APAPATNTAKIAITRIFTILSRNNSARLAMRDEVCTIKSTPQVAQPSLNADIVVGESSRPLHRGIYCGGVLMSRRRSRKRDAGHVSTCGANCAFLSVRQQ